MTNTIDLGGRDRLTVLFSYPNSPGDTSTLQETLEHWLQLSVDRDGLTAEGAKATVIPSGDGYALQLDGPPALEDSFKAYAERLPKFLEIGWTAYSTVVPALKKDGRWDPSPDPAPPPYRPWRFFLPWGMTFVNHVTLQFFHYPPIRLLEGTEDYLMDPVPVRCEELLAANGVATADLAKYNRVVDATPIAAEDDQGSKTKDASGAPVGDPTWGLIPIQFFHDYQTALVKLFLNPAAGAPGNTIPIVVYGAHPRDTFTELYGQKITRMQATTVEIIPGLKTAVIGSDHPYVFYASAQGFDTVGLGRIASAADCSQAVKQMTLDLIITRWQSVMASNPALNPQQVLQDCTAFWNNAAQQAQICALVRHQGSLYYASPTSLAFSYQVSLTDAQTFCNANGNNACAGMTTNS